MASLPGYDSWKLTEPIDMYPTPPSSTPRPDESERDWVLEAEQIVAGISPIAPQREHLLALMREIAKLEGGTE